MKPPLEPSKDDCCNSGCHPCIFDVFEKQLKLYQQFIESGTKLPDDLSENGISQTEYTKYQLIQATEVCDSHKLLVFKSISVDSKKVRWKPGDHFLLKYISKDLCCTKAYTPIKQKDCSKDHDFAIILKVYYDGLVSNYLNNLQEGDITLWRGPYGAFEITPNKFNRLIMIAQGTGIATFISIIKNILDNEDDITKIFLYYCTQSEKTILFRSELYAFKQYWNFRYKIFISNYSEHTKYKYQEPITHHKFSLEDLEPLELFQCDSQFLVCGSENFIDTYKQLLLRGKCRIENIFTF